MVPRKREVRCGSRTVSFVDKQIGVGYTWNKRTHKVPAGMVSLSAVADVLDDVMDVVDVVVIGAGLAGLYAAHLLGPTHRVAVLERDHTLGGRARTKTFAGATVATGAGIGRQAKDTRLQALLQGLGVPVRSFPVVHTAFYPCDGAAVGRLFAEVRTAFERTMPRPLGSTFQAFAQSVLGPAAYKQLVKCSGYSDFEQARVADVLYDYGFEDNYTDWTGLAVPWGALIDALRASVLRAGGSILQDCTATTLEPMADSGSTEGAGPRFRVRTPKGTVLAGAVVVATDIDSVRALLPRAAVYKHIHGQPFLRLYASFSGKSAAAMRVAVKGVTIVGGLLQKLIPVSDTVFMVAYADNASAKALHWLLSSSVESSKRGVAGVVEAALHMRKGSLKIDALRMVFFANGTHYNDPGLGAFPTASIQRPLPHVFVVGEAVSKHQGWVEGALESVESALTGTLLRRGPRPGAE